MRAAWGPPPESQETALRTFLAAPDPEPLLTFLQKTAQAQIEKEIKETTIKLLTYGLTEWSVTQFCYMSPFPFQESWIATGVCAQGSMIISNIQRGQHQPAKGCWPLGVGLAACQGIYVLPQNAFLLKGHLLNLGNNALETMTKGSKEYL